MTDPRTVTRYRKKPVVVEAMQFTLRSLDACEEFVGGDMGKDRDGDTVIATLEGAMKVSLGDWIICGVRGEFYPCKPDIFAATYAAVDAALPAAAPPLDDRAIRDLHTVLHDECQRIVANTPRAVAAIHAVIGLRAAREEEKA